jgi:hypothetical protein
MAKTGRLRLSELLAEKAVAEAKAGVVNTRLVFNMSYFGSLLPNDVEACLKSTLKSYLNYVIKKIEIVQF